MKDAYYLYSVEKTACNSAATRKHSWPNGTVIATFINREEKKMLAIITPLIFVAVLIALTLGISFLAVEMTLRLISRGLPAEPAKAIRRPINSRERYKYKARGQSQKTRLQAFAAR